MDDASFGSEGDETARLLAELPADGFDAVVVGTGLVESLLASALARDGHRVLHVDAAAQYGSDAAGLTLDGLERWAAALLPENDAQEPPMSPIVRDGRVALDARRALRAAWVHGPRPGPLFPPDVDEAQAVSDLLALQSPARLVCFDEGDEPEDDVVVEDATKAAVAALVAERANARRALVDASKRFNVDLAPRLCLARGEGTEAMVGCGVASYLEFAAVASIWHYDVASTSWTRVPCSKRDVFTSRDLEPAEKRRLMRFFQDAFDLGEADGGLAVNERDLTSSRALRRPQNRRMVGSVVQGVSSGAAPSTTGDNDDPGAPSADARDFRGALREEYGLPERLVSVVASAVAFLPDSDAPFREGREAAARHARALGTHVNCASALMAPLYGSAELPQGFCRACAVQGGVYALRLAPDAVLLDDDTGQEVRGVEFAASSSSRSSDESSDQGAAVTKVVACSKVVVAADYVPATSSRRAYRRLGIALVSRLRGGAATAPPVAVVVETASRVVSCAVLDASTYAVPVMGPCADAVCLVHLWLDGTDADECLAALDDAARAVGLDLASLWTITYSFPVHDDDTDESTGLSRGLAVCRRQRPHYDIFQEVRHAADLATSVLGLRALNPAPPDEEEDAGDGDAAGEDETAASPSTTTEEGTSSEGAPSRAPVDRRLVDDDDDDDLGSLGSLVAEVVGTTTTPDSGDGV